MLNIFYFILLGEHKSFNLVFLLVITFDLFILLSLFLRLSDVIFDYLVLGRFQVNFFQIRR